MKKIKQILAIICIILLVGMYVITFIMSLLDSSATLSMFKGCIAMTIFVPIVAYVYICLHKYAMTRSGRKDYYSANESEENPNKESDSDN